jgi:colicin import membrane protein
MPSYKQTPLQVLRHRRLDEERQAERSLADATAAERRAEVEAARLESAVGEARAARATARDGERLAGRASDAQGARRYLARLDEQVKAATLALSRHRAGALAAAVAVREAARTAHLSSRRRREVVEKAIARREAAAKRDADRRAEAELDDRRRDH